MDRLHLVRSYLRVPVAVRTTRRATAPLLRSNVIVLGSLPTWHRNVFCEMGISGHGEDIDGSVISR